MTTARPVVGVVGGGQLARMLLAPAARLDLPLVLLAGAEDAAAPFCRDLVVGAPDADGLRALAEACDVLTVEHELVDLDAMRQLEAEGHVLRPSPATLAVATDKVRQREVLGPAGVPTAPWTVADDLDTVIAFATDHGWPLVLKRPRGGYDGRGVYVAADADTAAEVLAEVAGPVLVEPALPLDHECAVLVARRPGGEVVVYDPVLTDQRDGMCREVLSPAPLDEAYVTEARRIAHLVADAVAPVGILAIELFVSGGQVLLNELAARPHNAGHVSIEGAATSQFENHLRAVADLPLGSPQPLAPAVMVNVVGGTTDPRDHLADALATADDVHVHLYGKDHRPGRKLGHVTAVGPDLDGALDRARRAADVLNA
ncbi:5-(carboxyamino)imidazole ribonucleotide synthase [Nitriliruptoraceae bacterium ZYF776]|nr:5-(carboxyamino)imidazole ribonucleotide synthase [Profundirhabdus halotolerans]